MTHPILYSFRRCPYAMRARMGIYSAQIKCAVREITLSDKPTHLLDISPKGTVPVLLTNKDRVIDESLDIMLWALSYNDPDNWLPEMRRDDIFELVKYNDEGFKPMLDRYKYPNRYPDEDCSSARENGLKFLQELEQRLAINGSLLGDKTTLADISIFPFVRQFAHVDKDWFYTLPLPATHKWLKQHLESNLFAKIMTKYTPWQEGDKPIYTIN